MLFEQFVGPLLGGVLIGVAVSLMLLLLGRVFGVSGILAGALVPVRGDTGWRVAAVLGMLTAGVLISFFAPDLLVGNTAGTPMRYVVAGLLVGFGTQLGSGCTSGHGVCGMSRLSPRSIVATITFILVGMVTVALLRTLGGAI